MGTTSTSSSRAAAAALAFAVASVTATASGCAASRPAAPTVADSGRICPVRAGHPLRYVDVFDGSPQEQALLMPEQLDDRTGFWELGYVYEAGRTVTVRCKYVDGASVDRPLTRKVRRCEYRVDPEGTLGVDCR